MVSYVDADTVAQQSDGVSDVRRLPLGWLGMLFLLFAGSALYFKYLKIFYLSPHLLLLPLIGLGILAWPRSSLIRSPFANALAANAWLLAFGFYTAIQSVLIGDASTGSQNFLMSSFAMGATFVTAVLLLAAPHAGQLMHRTMFVVYALGVTSCVLLLLQIFVSFGAFDIVSLTNRIGLSDTGQVNDYINNAIAAQARGRGLAESVHVFAATTIVVLAFGLYLAGSSTFAAFTLPIVLVAALMNQSVTAFVAFAIAWAAWSGFLGGGQGILWRALAIVLFVIAGMVVVPLFWNLLVGGLDDLMVYGAADSISSRLAAWDAALQMFVDHPLFGVGGSNFKPLVNTYDGFFLPKGNIFQMQEAHSIVFQTLSQWGAVGMFCLTMYFFKAFQAALRLRGPMARSLGIALTAVMLKAMTGNEILLFHLFFLSAVVLALDIEARAVSGRARMLAQSSGSAMDVGHGLRQTERT